MPDHTSSTLPNFISPDTTTSTNTSIDRPEVTQQSDDIEHQRAMREVDEWLRNEVFAELPSSRIPKEYDRHSGSLVNDSCAKFEPSKKPLDPSIGKVSEGTTSMPELIYPALPIDLSTLAHAHLVSRAVELASQFRENKDYDAIRDEFLQVSLALNQFKQLAPVFRDQPRLPFNKAEQKRFTQLLIDQIVIDLHWLHCRGETVRPIWPELQTLLAPASKFDCDAIATRLAAKNWSSDFRVQELIFVNDRQQRQLMQLRTKKLKETFRSVLEGKGKPNKADGRVAATMAEVRRAIGNWADSTHQIRGHEDMYESLWVARELLGAKASNDDIGELAGLRCGMPPLDRKTVAGKLKRLDAKLREMGVA